MYNINKHIVSLKNLLMICHFRLIGGIIQDIFPESDIFDIIINGAMINEWKAQRIINKMNEHPQVKVMNESPDFYTVQYYKSKNPKYGMTIYRYHGPVWHLYFYVLDHKEIKKN